MATVEISVTKGKLASLIEEAAQEELSNLTVDERLALPERFSVALTFNAPLKGGVDHTVKAEVRNDDGDATPRKLPDGIDDGSAGRSEQQRMRAASLIAPERGRVQRIALLPQLPPLAVERPSGRCGLRVALLALHYLNADPRTGYMTHPATGKARAPEWRVGHIELSAQEFERLFGLPDDGESICDLDLSIVSGDFEEFRHEFNVKNRKALWKRSPEVKIGVDEAAAQHAARLPGLIDEPGPWGGTGKITPLSWPDMATKAKAWLYGEPLAEVFSLAVGWTPPTTAQRLGLEANPDPPGPLMAARVKAMVRAADHADDHHHLLLTMLDGSILFVRDGCEEPHRPKDGCVGIAAFGCWDKVPCDSMPTFYGSSPCGDRRCRCRRQDLTA